MNSPNLKSLIPASKLVVVEKALQETFQTTEVDEIAKLAGGYSPALVYKIVVNNRPYVLRLIMHTNAFSDPARQFFCMDLAAQANITPAIHYANVEDALSITDFIETIPLTTQFLVRDDLLAEMAAIIRSIHALPLFPKLINFLDGIDGFIKDFKAAKILPESATEECFKYYAEIQKVYPRYDKDIVSSHNDLNPNNLLCDGKKIWVIDWEAAFQNDRYVDLAITKNYALSAQEEPFLKAYFGNYLDSYKEARFFLMQQICLIFYAMAFMKLIIASQPPDFSHDTNMETLRLQDFHVQLGNGKVTLASYEGKFSYAKTLLNEALYNMKTPRFAKSIAKIAE